jgi:hypothetical protein
MNYYHTPERRARASHVARTYVPLPDPTPEEISATCEQIQAGWSRVERRLRWAWAHSVGNVGLQPRSSRSGPDRWTVQEWRTIDYCEG